MKVVVFDMDETLYDERQFVEGGLRAVADAMEERWQIAASMALRLMRAELAHNGRGRVFDVALEAFGRRARGDILHCLSVYRGHVPQLRLYPDARRALRRLSQYSLYVVTDGTPRVQRAKARALGLYHLVDGVVATWHRGRRFGKPSPHAFHQIARREKATPHEIVYIADDPNKDFIQLKASGFKTVRLLRGRFSTLRLSAAHEAGRKIRSLDEITEDFLARL